MKEILIELKRIFPNRYVSIQHDVEIDKNGIMEENYQVFIYGVSLGRYDVSDNFESLKIVDDFLAYKFGTYKRQIK